MPDWLRETLDYLFQSPGSQFNYYVPILVASAALLCIPFYHYGLGSQVRFRRYPIHSFLLNRLSLWLTGIAAVWLLLLVGRYFNVAVLGWRFWLYLVVIASAVLYAWGLLWIYARGPRLLEEYATELQRKRYLAGATPSVPSITRRRQKRPANKR